MKKYVLVSLVIIIFLVFLISCSEDKDCDLNADGTISVIEQKICEGYVPADQNVNNNSDETVPLSDTQEVSIDSNYIPDAFIVIHCEPGENAKTTEEPEEYWSMLEDLVAFADQYNFKLTLLFNPQWATYILENDKLTEVRTWEANGHEIGVHHHGPSYGSLWNGYTDKSGYESNREYIGTIEDMMNLLNQLPASGQVVTGGIAKEADEQYDYPDGILYDVEGTANGDILSTLTPIMISGHSVTQLTHKKFGQTEDQIFQGTPATVNDIADALIRAESGQVIGIIFHVHEFEEIKSDLEDLFELYSEKDVHVKSVKEIMINQ